VIDRHNLVFKSLKQFLQKGTNNVTILPGNHDAALVYPTVAQTVLSAIASEPVTDTDCRPGRRVCISKKGYWLSEDGLVFADHGHVFDEANRFRSWPDSRIAKDGETYLERPFGEQMVQRFYNKYEHQFPIVDNLSKESDGVRYIAEVEGFSGAVDAVADFFRFFLFDTSWRQRVAFLGPDDKPVKRPDWDIKKIQDEYDIDFLISSLPFDDKIQRIAKDNKKTIKVKPKDLPEEEIIAICDYREQLRKESDKNEPNSCPTKSGHLGRLVTEVLGREEINMKEHLLKTYREMWTSDNRTPAFRIYLFGHTHTRYKKNVMVDDEGGWPITVCNTGAFQRVATREQIDSIKKCKKARQGANLTDAEVLTKIRIEDLPPCYTFVRIDPYKKEADPRRAKPEAKLMYWTLNSNGKWIEGEDSDCKVTLCP
jgi:hypothetical protein